MLVEIDRNGSCERCVYRIQLLIGLTLHRSIKSANNATMDDLGTVDLSLKIQGLTVVVQFCVLRNLSISCLLGAQFLYDSRAVLDFARKSLSVYDGRWLRSLFRRLWSCISRTFEIFHIIFLFKVFPHSHIASIRLIPSNLKHPVINNNT